MGLFRQALVSSPAVVVSLLSGRTIKGAMVENGKNGIVLRAASVEDRNESRQVTWVALDGDVQIRWDQIEFFQSGLDHSVLGSVLD